MRARDGRAEDEPKLIEAQVGRVRLMYDGQRLRLTLLVSDESGRQRPGPHVDLWAERLSRAPDAAAVLWEFAEAVRRRSQEAA